MKKENRIKLKVKGLNQEKVINKLIKTTDLYNFKRESHNTCQFEINFKHRKAVNKILKENGMEILSQKHIGFFSFFKRIFTSYGILTALCIFLALYSLQYSFIWKIEVRGEEIVQEREIKDFVEDNLGNRFKRNIDTKNLELKIKENFKKISSVSIAIVGQTLVLNLNEAVLPQEMEGEYFPLISEFDGLVTQINLIQGTLAVNEGDLVKKGDVLVYPYVVDTDGQQRAVAPKANIYADIWLSEKIMHYDYLITQRRTGKVKVSNEVYLNNLLIYSNKVNNNFIDFEVEEEEILLTKNLLLPLKLKKIYFYQTEIVEIKEDFDNVKEKIIASLREKVLIFLKENEIIKEENIAIREYGGCREVSLLLTINRNIGG